jgi:DUF1365 family protein
MTASCLYVGRLRHRRRGDIEHAFSYPVWHALVDLDELAALDREVSGFGHNRFALASFHDRDHLGPEPGPLRAKLDRWLKAQGRPATTGPVRLLTGLRLAGSVFNPVSFFFCHRPDGSLSEVVAEVNNTFGESHCYRLEGTATTDGVVRDEFAKTFHVSPFQPVTGRYRFRITTPGERLVLHIDVLRDGRRAFDSTLTAERRPLDGRTLRRTVLRHPHLALWTLGRIHWQALRLWLKGAPFHTKPPLPATAWRTRHG